MVLKSVFYLFLDGLPYQIRRAQSTLSFSHETMYFWIAKSLWEMMISILVSQSLKKKQKKTYAQDRIRSP